MNDDNVGKFAETAMGMVELYKRKNHDYGDSFGSIADMLREKFGDNASFGYMYGHLKEKITRIETVAGSGSMVGESIKDSLIDLASYSIMTLNKLNEYGKD